MDEIHSLLTREGIKIVLQEYMMNNRKLYLTEVDIHRLPHPLSTEELRQQIFFMSLFWDNIVISDSILNNNPNLRQLILPEIEKPKNKPKALKDFNYLIEKGYIRPAMRDDIQGFGELREKHKKPLPVPDLPSRDYSEELDRISPEKYRERFSSKKVEDCFEKNLYKIFSNNNSWENFQIPQDVSQQIFNFIENRGIKPINYRELRVYLEHPEKYNLTHESSEQIKKYYDVINNRISEAYRFNVPAVLNIDSEATHKSLPWWVQLGTHSNFSYSMLNKIKKEPYKIRPTWVFDKEIIGEIPAEALDETKDWASYKDLMKQYEHINFSEPTDDFFKNIVEIWNEYTIDLENHMKKELESRVKMDYIIRRGNNRWAYLKCVLLGGISLLAFDFGLYSAIPSFAVTFCIAHSSYKDWINDIEEIKHLERLTGKPIMNIDIIQDT